MTFFSSISQRKYLNSVFIKYLYHCIIMDSTVITLYTLTDYTDMRGVSAHTPLGLGTPIVKVWLELPFLGLAIK